MMKIIKKFGMPSSQTQYVCFHGNEMNGCNVFFCNQSTDTKAVILSSDNIVDGYPSPNGIYILRPFQRVVHIGDGVFRLENDYPEIRKNIAAKFRALTSTVKDMFHG